MSQVRKVLQALKGQLVLLAHKVLLVLLVRGENEANKALLALLGNKGREVLLESVDLLVLLVRRGRTPTTTTSRQQRTIRSYHEGSGQTLTEETTTEMQKKV